MGDDAVRAFDEITAVKKNPIPREALPTGAIERLEAAARLLEEVTAVKDLPIPRNALPTGAIERLDATSGVIEDNFATVAMPALEGPAEERNADPAAGGGAIAAAVADASEAVAADTSEADPGLSTNNASSTDVIARIRGLRPITKADASTSTARSRGLLYASIAVSLACLCGSAGVVLWARDEVHRVRTAEAAMQLELAAMRNAAPFVQRVDVPLVPAVAAPAQPLAVEPRACSLRVTASVPGATVWVDGVPQGEAPVVLAVDCQLQRVEVRHPRYEVFEQTLLPDGVADIDARLERKKRRSRSARR